MKCKNKIGYLIIHISTLVYILINLMPLNLYDLNFNKGVCVLMFGRIAVVTGANKGIGFEIVRQLAAAGVVVVLTARDEQRGVEATSKLHNLGLSNVVFHQVDVTNINSITLLVHFIKAKFGRLDILVCLLL